jgi:hypothetical protein
MEPCLTTARVHGHEPIDRLPNHLGDRHAAAGRLGSEPPHLVFREGDLRPNHGVIIRSFVISRHAFRRTSWGRSIAVFEPPSVAPIISMARHASSNAGA